jgi:hypothetical protein
VSTTWQARRDFGEGTRANFIPELVGYGYLPAGAGRFYLRPGARLAYSGLEQSEMPSALQLIERDLFVSGELGLLWDAPAVPSFTLGALLVYRDVRLDTDLPITPGEDRHSGSDLLPGAFAQLGVGLPLWRGRFVLEPFARFELIRGDNRSRWRYGLELTVQLR